MVNYRKSSSTVTQPASGKKNVDLWERLHALEHRSHADLVNYYKIIMLYIKCILIFTTLY